METSICRESGLIDGMMSDWVTGWFSFIDWGSGRKKKGKSGAFQCSEPSRGVPAKETRENSPK